MKQVGFAARLLALVAVLSLAAFVVTGCGDDKSDNSGSTATASGDSGDSGNSGATKTYEDGDTVGEEKKVVVDSDQEFDATEQEIIERVGEFGDATANKDYEKLCNDLLSKAARKIGGDCVKTFSQTGESLKDFKLTIKSVEVAKDGKTATAMIDVSSNVQKTSQSQSLPLILEDGEWRIQILGQ
jgi:hypothetical protein